jgi:hypothetical protein
MCRGYALAAELRMKATVSSHQVLSAHKLADALFPRMAVRCRTHMPLIARTCRVELA